MSINACTEDGFVFRTRMRTLADSFFKRADHLKNSCDRARVSRGREPTLTLRRCRYLSIKNHRAQSKRVLRFSGCTHGGIHPVGYSGYMHILRDLVLCICIFSALRRRSQLITSFAWTRHSNRANPRSDANPARHSPQRQRERAEHLQPHPQESPDDAKAGNTSLCAEGHAGLKGISALYFL